MPESHRAIAAGATDRMFDAVPSNAAPCRQWTYFPRIIEGGASRASPQTFRVLIESAAGRLAIVTVERRTIPSAALAANLAALLDERPFELATRERIRGEFEARHGDTIELHDLDLDLDDPLELTGAIPRALADATRHFNSPGSTLVSLAAMRNAIVERLQEDWHTLRAEFIARLDPEAVAQSRAINGLRPSAYNYICTVSLQQRRNRAQALELYPILTSNLMTPPYRVIRQTIDDGRPLVDALALYFGAPKAMIRALRGVAPADLGPFARQIPTLALLLKSLPASWWPHDPETWQRLTKSAMAIAKVSRHPITTSTNQLWLRRCAQKGYVLDDVAPETIVRMGEEIDEFLAMLRQALAWALSMQVSVNSRRRPEMIVSDLKAGLGLIRLAQLARRFGDAYRRAVADFATEAELWTGVRWPSPMTTQVLGEIVIQPLMTPAELYEEGAMMANCVAGYVRQCLCGTSQIWSVRHRDGKHLSTLETRIRLQNNQRQAIFVGQHKAFRNSEPTLLEREAVRRLLKAFAEASEEKDAYLNWRQAVRGKPLEVRQQYALTQPMIIALETVLPKRWGWQRLLEGDPGRT